MRTLFALLRHGETSWNREKRIQGQSESPLTLEGKRQALGWGAPLAAWRFDRMLCSDLGRARETAVLCNRSLALPCGLDPRLREQHWGHWEGQTLSELRKCSTLLAAAEAQGWDFTPPEGESRRELLARSLAALEEAAHRTPGARVLVICHNGVLRALAHHLTGSPYTPDGPNPFAPAKRPPRGALLLLEHNGGGLHLLHPAHPLAPVWSGSPHEEPQEGKER